MFCRISESMSHPNPLPERLRALSRFSPPAGGWAEMNRRLHARRRNYAIAGGGFALAASVLVGVGLVSLRPDAGVPAAAPGAVASRAAPRPMSPALAQLISRSQTLERELSSLRPQVAVWDTDRDTRALLLETELRRVDEQLNFPESSEKASEQLWRRRVRLMNALVELHETGNEAPALQYASYQY
jgi:hypothetical protein